MTTTTSWLVTVPASDYNFKSALSRATADEIRQAIEMVKEQEKPPKGKIKDLERRLKQL